MAHGASTILADPEVVRRLMEHLVEAFEKFADSEAEKSDEGLRFVDALMGCHNFYKAIILDLERRTGAPVRQVAINTLMESFRERR